MPERAVTQVERVLALKTFELFRELAPTELAALAQNVKPRTFKAGAPLFKSGVPIRTLQFVLHGSVEVTGDGQLPIRIGPQQVVGGLAAFTGEAQQQQARAVEETFTLQLHRDDLQDVFEDNFGVLVGMLRSLARAQLNARRALGERAGYVAAPPPRRARGALGEVGLVEKLFFLRQAMDFAGSRVEALADLAQEAEVLRLAAGHEVWRLGEIADWMMIVLDGEIAGSTEQGVQKFEFGPGTLVGSIDSIAGQPRWFAATASVATTALRIRVQHLLDVIEDDVDFAMEMVRVLSLTLRGLQQRAAPDLSAAQPIR